MTATTLNIPSAILVIGGLSFIFGIIVIVDMARRPDWVWARAGSNKALWLVLEIVTLLLFYFASLVVGVIYLGVVRPRLAAAERQGGPWTGGPGHASPWGGDSASGPHPGWGQTTPGGYPGQPPAAGPGPWAYPGAGGPAGPSPYGPQSMAPQPVAPAQPVENPPFGWYADPSGRHEKRYWDGTRWTEHVSDGEDRSTDPVTG